MVFTLTSCNNNNNAPASMDIATLPVNQDESAVTSNNVPESPNPYLSIIGRREKAESRPDEFSWDEVYYTYDLVTKELKEICVLPHDSGYTTGVVSLWDNAVYFSRKGEKGNDRICKYDITSSEVEFIEDENWSYNDFTLVDPETLLVIALTPEHTITPALFNLTSETFTYMADVNGEDLALYSAGSLLMNYNYLYDKFSWTYYELEDRYSSGYTGHAEAIKRYMAIIPSSLEKSDMIYLDMATAAYEVLHMILINEKVSLVEIRETSFDDSTLIYSDDGHIIGGGWVYVDKHYYLTIDGENISLTETENPFLEDMYISQGFTFDEGETFYCRGGYSITETTYYGGIFKYDSKTKEITPILLGIEGLLSIANFRVVG